MINEKYAKQDELLFFHIRQLQDGHIESYNEIYNLSSKYIYKIIYDIVQDYHTTEDMMQETFLKIYNNIGKLQSPEAYYVWAGRIATNLCIRYRQKYRKEEIQSPIDDGEGNETFIFDTVADDNEMFIPESVMDNKEHQRLIGEVIASLSVDQKLAVQCFYFEEMSIKEIAQQMECSEGTVKSRLNYARKTIKEAVLRIERTQGTKLYSLAAVPVLLIAYRYFAEVSVSASAVSAVASAGATTATGTTATMTTATASTTATVTTLSGKVVAIIVAGTIAAGGLIGGGIAVARNITQTNNEIQTEETPKADEIKPSDDITGSDATKEPGRVDTCHKWKKPEEINCTVYNESRYVDTNGILSEDYVKSEYIGTGRLRLDGAYNVGIVDGKRSGYYVMQMESELVDYDKRVAFGNQSAEELEKQRLFSEQVGYLVGEDAEIAIGDVTNYLYYLLLEKTVTDSEWNMMSENEKTEFINNLDIYIRENCAGFVLEYDGQYYLIELGYFESVFNPDQSKSVRDMDEDSSIEGDEFSLIRLTYVIYIIKIEKMNT